MADSSSAMLLDLEALDCPICCDALAAPIFQCDNGHIICSTCCNKLIRNKCPSCSLPIGHIRCRAMERIIKGIIVPCPNGCTKRFSYGAKELSTHEKESCVLSPCSCPVKNCDYTGSYKDLYNHFGIHIGESTRRHCYQFIGKFADITFEIPDYTSTVIKEEDKDGLLFVFQCFNEKDPYGTCCVTVSCIAPCATEVGEFYCYISTEGNYTELLKVKRIRKLSYKTPKEDFMLVPSYGRRSLKLRVCVCKVEGI